MQKYKNRWLTPIELYELYGFSLSWQAKARMSANKIQIPFIKLGKFVRYDRQEIDKWLEEHKVL
ncbi:MAG TPA: DNA-binding protein [Sulfurospirillum sp. UBA12182]|nr:MAG TPA: DNA-binding protein [Sulfurospirillum sp. UBA12182]